MMPSCAELCDERPFERARTCLVSCKLCITMTEAFVHDLLDNLLRKLMATGLSPELACHKSTVQNLCHTGRMHHFAYCWHVEQKLRFCFYRLGQGSVCQMRSFSRVSTRL